MSKLLEKEELLIRYLLGNASEAEQEEIEAELFADNELFERMIFVENDLIDNFIRGKLSREEEEYFKKQYFATKARHNRVDVSKTFIQVATESRLKNASDKKVKTEKQSWIGRLRLPLGGFAWARAAVLALLFISVSLGVYLIWKNGKHGGDMAQTSVPSPKPSADATPALAATNPTPLPVNDENKNAPEKRAPKKDASKPVIATLILSGGAVRGGSSSSILQIKDNTSLVSIKVKVSGNSYTSYKGTIKRVTGEEIWRGNLSHKGAMVEAVISSQQFSQGDYILAVEGITAEGSIEPVRESYFKVKISN